MALGLLLGLGQGAMTRNYKRAIYGLVGGTLAGLVGGAVYEIVTQLYLSIDAPTKKLLKEIDNPLFEDYWERMNKSLEYLSKKRERTAIRLTAIKDLMRKKERFKKQRVLH